ncbi:transmembrane amino acid transporter protein-domain-containing protein [Pilobolus umbonatus]|nr:transmembrane amino acid transporter protein-domain-containing protein [Pilobolus umbonatus]
MDIPSNSPKGESNVPRIRNLHPSQFTPDHYGTIQEDAIPIERTVSSFSERIGSFVGSYSRTSLMFMAENLAVPSNPLLDEEEDKYSAISSEYVSRMPSKNSVSRLSRIDSNNAGGSSINANEQSALLFSHLDKVLSVRSVVTLADDYRFEAHPVASKKSSFTQSIFNSINILIGIGILALPLGFKCAGWGIGMIVFVFCCGLTNYTAKLLKRCLDLDPESSTYGDMGALAFGLRGRIWVTTLFITELITSSVALVVLLGDGIDSLFPGFDLKTTRLVSFLILTPMLFIPVRNLSYTSLLGIISAFSITIIMIVDGLGKDYAPGSLIEPADTEIWPSNWMTVPLSFGLIMAGFAGHAVFPTVYRDMDNPKQYNTMVNWTYVATTIVYFSVAACGYAMFGSETMQEVYNSTFRGYTLIVITQNIIAVPEYNQTLNRMGVWLIAMNPIAKYGLTVNPVNLSWQMWLFKGTNIQEWCDKGSMRLPILTGLGKIAISAFIVCLAYILPNFDKIMSLLGAFFSFMISGIFPLICHIRLFGDSLSPQQRMLDYTLIIVASSMALSGTVWSFM